MTGVDHGRGLKDSVLNHLSSSHNHFHRGGVRLYGLWGAWARALGTVARVDALEVHIFRSSRCRAVPCPPVSFCRCNPGDFGGVEFLRVDEFGSIFSRDAFVMNMLTVMICGQNITSLMILVHDTATTRLAPGRDCSVSSVETWTHPGPTRRNPN